MARGADPAGNAPRPFGHAVVVGGSVAGLLAARVLAERFAAVTLVERDALADAGAGPRKGVPQGRHVHILLARGRLIAEDLLPGLGAELRAAGAVPVNAGRQLAWHQGGGWRVPHDSELELLSLTRPLLEARIAARVRALPNVAVRDRAEVRGWTSDGRRRVTGVRLRGRSGRAGGVVEEIAADLVVDAAGRGSPTPRWLVGLGFDAPPAERLPAPVGYASCVFRRPPERGRGWRALLVTGTPGRRSGLVFPVEDGRWLVTLAAFFDEPLPRDHEGFLAFARSLPAPDVGDAIRGAEPLSGVERFRFAGSQRHRYDRLGRLPEGLIALGDAVCSFSPVYGQGMTVGAVEADLLGQALDAARRRWGGIDAGFGRRWFRGIAATVDSAWNGASLEDFRFPELAHRRPARLAPLTWYLGRVHRATRRSAAVTDQLYRVINLLDAPAALFRPRVLADVLLGRPRRPDAPAAGVTVRPAGGPARRRRPAGS